MNAPIQGTAADIMKLAMLAVDSGLNQPRIIDAGVYPIKVVFDCSWDIEHGVSVFIYKENVLSLEEMDEIAQHLQ